mmetsp:Transcript_14590/g.22830  ORF Transcript_14590/g.22830 Transcript_14590/m.22830 type:complete len:721 (-) Transcript_14590:173-2335(-)
MTDPVKTPTSSVSAAAPRSASSSASRTSSRRNLRPSGTHRSASSIALMQQKLAEMGSYAKYYKAITQNPFQVKIRCACGRSRNMAWMFLCTWCATGTKVEQEKDSTEAPYSKLQQELDAQKEKDKDKEQESDEKQEQKEELQRAFLSCDLCAQKMTESYYCPHCLAAYPAHYVKLHTRCTRCVSCPVCTSPLEKIVYSGANTGSSSSSSSSKDAQPSSAASPAAKKKDVYLYQCPFCFWSSNIVGLEASESEALLENLKQKLKRPVEEKTVIMEDIKNRYLNINEDLRKEEDRIEKAKRFHTYKGNRLFSSKKDSKEEAGSQSGHSATDRLKRRKKTLTPSLTKLKIPSMTEHGRQPTTQQLSALDSISKAQETKFEKYHTLSKQAERNVEPPLDQRYVSQFHLRNVSPLQHRLSDPLNQNLEMDKYVPQRFHLMTKESYKCPNRACGKYVCKPTLRGRQANYDKRTAVLDYLPRINIRLLSGNLMTTSKSELLIMVQNRHLHAAEFMFDTSINEDDLYSTAKIACSSDWFLVDPADIHIKGGKQKDETRANGDYVKGKEAGVHFSVSPKHYSTGPRDVKFSVRCVFKTKLQLKEDKSDSGTTSTTKDAGSTKDDKDSKNSSSSKDKEDATSLMQVELPYILDFELGPPKTPELATTASPSSSSPGLHAISEATTADNNNDIDDDGNNNGDGDADADDKAQHSTPAMVKARKSNENLLNT